MSNLFCLSKYIDAEVLGILLSIFAWLDVMLFLSLISKKKAKCKVNMGRMAIKSLPLENVFSAEEVERLTVYFRLGYFEDNLCRRNLNDYAKLKNYHMDRGLLAYKDGKIYASISNEGENLRAYDSSRSTVFLKTMHFFKEEWELLQPSVTTFNLYTWLKWFPPMRAEQSYVLGAYGICCLPKDKETLLGLIEEKGW